MTQKIKIGIIGAGTWGRVHAIAFSEMAEADLVGICDLSLSRAEALTAEFGGKASCDVAAFLKTVDAVAIATPDHLHREVAIQALEAGTPVLIEKPLATTVEDAEAIADAVARTGTPLMVDFHARWHPNYIGAKRAVDEGRLGAVQMGYIRLHDRIEVPTSMLGWSGGSGPDWFLMAHTIDAISWILGARPSSVFAKGSSGVLKARGVDTLDGIQAIIRFGSASVMFDTNWILPDGFPSLVDHRMTLYGSEGSLDMSNVPTLDLSGSTFGRPFSSVATERPGNHFGPLYEPMKDFVRGVRDSQPLTPTVTDGVWVTRAIASLRRSIQTEKEEKIG